MEYGSCKHLFGIQKREWAFEFKISGERKGGESDAMIRFQQYGNMEAAIKGVQKMVAFRVQVGALWRKSPNNTGVTKEEAFPDIALYSELRFDIDFEDQVFLSGVKCHPLSGREFNVAWLICKVQQSILHGAMEKEFGFKCLLFVFSGRRGWHLWVCDKRAMELSSTAREAILDFVSIKWSQIIPRRGFKFLEHVFFQHVCDMIMQHACFATVIEELGLFRGDRADAMLELLVPFTRVPDLSVETLRRDVLAMFRSRQNVSTGKDMWALFEKAIFESITNHLLERQKEDGNARGEKMAKRGLNMRGPSSMRLYANNDELRHVETKNIMKVALLRIFYPVFDSGVTVQLQHLLALPFSVHQTTGFVRTPLDVDAFDSCEIPSFVHFRDAIADPCKLEVAYWAMEKFIRTINGEYSSASRA